MTVEPDPDLATSVDLAHHGDAELAPGLLDLAVNVRPDPLPDWLSTAILAACGRLDGYPDPRAATAAIAARHRRPVSEVLLTAGAAEAFTLIAQGLPVGRAAIVYPQFTEPEVALRAAGWQIERVLLDPGDGFALHPELIPEDCSLLVVGNPTNPTGTLHAGALLRGLCRPGRTVVVDEAFMDSIPDEPESLAGLADLSGLLVVRSLTKTWGLAGLRIGYLLGDPALIAAARAVQPRWSVSVPALAAAAACMRPVAIEECRRRADLVAGERERLRKGLSERGFQVADRSFGPFLLVRHPGRPGLHAELRRYRIAVRRSDTFPGLGAGWLRISVRDAAGTARLLATLDHLLAGVALPEPAAGVVTLIGGGPGPVGQVTVQGLLALQRADVVITDRLAPLALLAELPAHVEIIDAAKNPGGSAMPQEKINMLLIEHARAGHRVVRLKGGDPFVFGRGFEELQACAVAGVRTEVISGLTSAVAGPAAAGLPVTHRGVTHGFTVVSGHLPPEHPASLVDWPALARSRMTLVILMGVANLPAIAEALLAAGLPGQTCAALVADAGSPRQRELRSTLGEVAVAAASIQLAPPAIVVIGAVAGLAGLPA